MKNARLNSHNGQVRDTGSVHGGKVVAGHCFCPRLLLSLFLALGLLVCPALSVKSISQSSEEKVLLAYELRIDGKSSDAKTILNEVLGTDSTFAMANLEMARLLAEVNPMNTGEIMSYCDRALEAAPSNVQYNFYKAQMDFLAAFIAMHRGDEKAVAEMIAETRETFNHVIELDPGCAEARLYLVDIYSTLPPEMGGNPEMAEELILQLEQIDGFAASRGRMATLGEGVSRSQYWKDYIDKSGASEEAIVLLGKAFLMEGNIDSAEYWLNGVISRHPEQVELYLHLARGYIYKVMSGQDTTSYSLDQAEVYMDKYLDSSVEKPVCTEAWCYGLLARVQMFQDEKEEYERSMKKAQELCPTFSKAMAVPVKDDPPNELHYHYSSFFTPF